MTKVALPKTKQMIVAGEREIVERDSGEIVARAGEKKKEEKNQFPTVAICDDWSKKARKESHPIHGAREPLYVQHVDYSKHQHFGDLGDSKYQG